MTTQEAIEMIRDDMKKHHDQLSGEYRKALSMAISALKAQSISPTQMSVTSDAVNRTLAIETAIDAADEWDGGGDITMIEKALKELPSAQPEIIVCADCKHWICHDRRCGYWNHGVKPMEWCCHAKRNDNG